MKRARSLSISLLAVLGCAGEAPAPAPSAAASQPLVAVASTTAIGATTATSPATVPPLEMSRDLVADVRTLGERIDSAARAFDASPTSVAARSQLVAALHLRAHVLDTTSDLRRALELAETAPSSGVDPDFEAVLLRARARSAVRRFPQALADVKLASKLADSAASKQQARSLETSILASMGRYAEAMPRLEKRSRSERSTRNLGEQGALLASLGLYREAETLFLQAEVQFRGLSPLGLVDVWFERARMWERAGSLDQAMPLYVAAHRKMRHHVPVALRLASLSTPDEGISMLEPLTAATDSPQLLAQLGVLQNQRVAGSGEVTVQRATIAYQEAYLALPEAIAESGARFFLGAGGDAARAVTLARKNAEVSATADALELLIIAAQAHSDTELLCSARQGARRLHRASPSLKDRLAQLEGKIDCAVDGITPAASSSKPTRGR